MAIYRQGQSAKGEHFLTTCDLTGFNGRLDAVYLTNDEEDIPPDEAGALNGLRQALVCKEVQDHPEVFDLVVVGGGVAGIFMALAAKRLGSRVLLINDRPVLGGCNSSEIRVCMGGMINIPPYERIGDIVKEIAPVMGDPSIYPASYFEDDRKRQAYRACQ